MQLRIAKTPHREFWHCATHALDECRAEVWQVVWQVVELGSNLGPISSEQGRKTGCKTQNRPKRTNHIASVSLPWAQGVGGSNPLAPTKHILSFHAVVSRDPADGPIAFAGGPFQSFSIQDCHYATRVFDYSCLLQSSGCNRNAWTSAA